MLSRLLVVVVVAVGGLALANAGAVAPAAEAAAAAAVEGESRDPKLFPVVKIVSFENGPCFAANGDQGTCYSQKECEAFGGAASGTCANGFGVCCVLTATCDDTITINGTYFQSSSYPTAFSSYGTCMVDIVPPAGTCQILLEFIDFELAGPIEGDCSNDTFVVMGANPGSNIPTLCGSNSGQHMYIDVDNSEGPFKLVVTMSALSYSRHWKIKVIFLDEFDPCKAPNRCLQYYKDTSGSFSSFNYGSNAPQMLNEQAYSICFAYVPGFCDIGLNFVRLDLGNVNLPCEGDYLGLESERVCGDFTTYSTQLNATGPMLIRGASDEENSNIEEGFSANYMMMAC